MPHVITKTRLQVVAGVSALVVIAMSTRAASAYSAAPSATPVIAADSTPRPALWNRDTLDGLSGKLRMKLMTARPNDTTDVLFRLFGDSAVKRPGVYVARDTVEANAFAFVSLVPFTAKKNGKLGDYRMGSWPA